MSTLNETPATETPKNEVKLGFFPGSLGAFQVSAYGSIQRLGLPKAVAHKVAQDFGGDLGNAMRGDAELYGKVAKAKKDGETSIKFSGKGAKQKMTVSMGVVRVAQIMDDLRKENLLASCKFEAKQFGDNIADYLVDCESWATTITVK